MRWNIDSCSGTIPDQMFNTINISPYASHETTTSHIAKYRLYIICPSMWRHNIYINTYLYAMERRGTFDWFGAKMALFWLFHLLNITTDNSLATRLHGQ